MMYLELVSPVPEGRLQHMREVNLENNYNETFNMSVAPLMKRPSHLEVHELYVPQRFCDLEQGNQENLVSSRSDDDMIDPSEFFLKDGHPVKYVFMQGEAYTGKTMFCLHLLRDWYNMKQAERFHRTACLSPWEKVLLMYDFVFYIDLAHVDLDRFSLKEMAMRDAFRHHGSCKDVVNYVLSTNRYRCLIIADGLDEWRISKQGERMLIYSGVPNMDGMINSTILITARPWKMNVVAGLMGERHRFVELVGLEPRGIEKAVRNILGNFYSFDSMTDVYRVLDFELRKRCLDPKFKSLMYRSMITISTLHFWMEEMDRQVADSYTGYYSLMLKMIITKGHDSAPRRFNYQNIKDKIVKKPPKGMEVPETIQNTWTISTYVVVLCTFGELAYEGLMARETHMVFDKDKLEDRVGRYQLLFAVHVGIISYSRKPESLNGNVVVVKFFDETMQEHLMALYLVCYAEVRESFLKNLTSLEIVMRFFDVLLFMLGLSPALAPTISKQISDLANKNVEVMAYRESGEDRDDFASQLFNLQVGGYKEVKESYHRSKKPQEVIDFLVTDIYIPCGDLSPAMLKVTSDVLCHQHDNILSFYMSDVIENTDIPEPTELEKMQRGLAEDALTKFLENTASLQYLYLDCQPRGRTLSRICPKVESMVAVSLTRVTLTSEAVQDLQRIIRSSPQLRNLGLLEIRFDSEQSSTLSLSSLLKLLPESSRLSTLHIDYMEKGEDRRTLVNVLPRLTHLQDVSYHGNPNDTEYNIAILQILLSMKCLRSLELWGITLADRPLEFGRVMLHLEKLALRSVKMPLEDWQVFLDSLVGVNRMFKIALSHSNISDEQRHVINTSPHFKVLEDEGLDLLEFCRVAPS